MRLDTTYIGRFATQIDYPQNMVNTAFLDVGRDDDDGVPARQQVGKVAHRTTHGPDQRARSLACAPGGRQRSEFTAF
jgi:hypothetical protein